MALEISGNKENLSLSWETFLLFNIVNDEGKTRQKPLILYFTFHLRSPTPLQQWLANCIQENTLQWFYRAAELH